MDFVRLSSVVRACPDARSARRIQAHTSVFAKILRVSEKPPWGGRRHTQTSKKISSALNATLQTDRETLNWRNWPVKSVPIDSLIINEPFVVVCRLAEGELKREVAGEQRDRSDVRWIDR